METLNTASMQFTLETAIGIASAAVGLVFGYAAIAKIANIRNLAAGIRAYQIVPHRLVLPAALILIALESLIAVGHLGVIALEVIIPATTILLFGFLCITVIQLIRGVERPCLCFGANRDDSVDFTTVTRIVLLLVTDLVLYQILADRGDSVTVHSRMVAIDVIGNIAVAAVIVVLVGWCLTGPKFHRAWRIVKS